MHQRSSRPCLYGYCRGSDGAAEYVRATRDLAVVQILVVWPTVYSSAPLTDHCQHHCSGSGGTKEHMYTTRDLAGVQILVELPTACTSAPLVHACAAIAGGPMLLLSMCGPRTTLP